MISDRCPEESTSAKEQNMKSMESHRSTSAANKSGPFFQKSRGNGFFQPSRSGGFFSGGAAGSGGMAPSDNVQTKLPIGQPHDVYEKEADSLADKVVQRLSQGGESHEPAPAPAPAVTPFMPAGANAAP